ncbi:transposase family protein [Streptomyces sp. NPDC056930]|uniref:helix-turn-helix domain-containing protein n=1 Tax=Streptomyces sp. NPDC056930 TaxID=3345967 RepID=UPI00363395D0
MSEALRRVIDALADTSEGDRAAVPNALGTPGRPQRPVRDTPRTPLPPPGCPFWNYSLRPEPYAQVSDVPDPFDQPSPDLAPLCHPGLTGLPAAEWDTMITTLTTLHEDQREAGLNIRRGHRPRIKGDGGTGRRPVLTLADRLLATLLHYRHRLPQVAIARLFSITPETINRRIRDIRQLLATAGHTAHPATDRLATLDDPHKLAATTGISHPLEIKTAS